MRLSCGGCFNITVMKARKLLITGGLYSTVLSRKVQELHAQGLLCRLPLFTSVPVAADSTITTTSATEPSLVERLIEAVSAIFGPQANGTLAGDGVVKAMTFNAMLFVPMGYLLLLWFRRLRKRPWLAVVICIAVSVGIELLQEWTGLGMADWKDVVSNALGGAVGVLIVKVSGRWFSCD